MNITPQRVPSRFVAAAAARRIHASPGERLAFDAAFVILAFVDPDPVLFPDCECLRHLA